MSKPENQVFELLKNPNFVQWVQNPTEETLHFWSKWLANHPERRKDVEVARRIVGSARLRYDKPVSQKVYDQILENIVSHNGGKKHIIKGIYERWKPVAAAVIAMAVLAGAFFFKGLVIQEKVPLAQVIWKQKKALHGQKITTRLPDKTIITLNAGSGITFPETFSDSIREVRLSGEAFFQVEKDADKPFLVRVNGNYVKVLGTSFNVRAYSDEDKVKVAVATGRVAYSTHTGEQVMLDPDEMAIHDEQRQSLITEKVNKPEAFGWKDKILYFNKSSFDEIRAKLEKWYGIEITVRGAFSSGVKGIPSEKTFSGQFHNPSLNEVLKGLSFLYRFDFEMEGKRMLLTPKPMPVN